MTCSAPCASSSGKWKIRGREADDVTTELPGRMQSVQKWLDRLGEAPVAADVHECCVSADTGGGDRCAGTCDAPRLAQRLKSTFTFRQVIQGAEK